MPRVAASKEQSKPKSGLKKGPKKGFKRAQSSAKTTATAALEKRAQKARLKLKEATDKIDQEQAGVTALRSEAKSLRGVFARSKKASDKAALKKVRGAITKKAQRIAKLKTNRLEAKLGFKRVQLDFSLAEQEAKNAAKLKEKQLELEKKSKDVDLKRAIEGFTAQWHKKRGKTIKKRLTVLKKGMDKRLRTIQARGIKKLDLEQKKINRSLKAQA